MYLPVDPAALADLRGDCDELHDDLRAFAQSFVPLAERVQALQTRVEAARAETRGRIHAVSDVAVMPPGDAAELEQGVCTVIDMLTGFRRMVDALFAAGNIVDPDAVLDGQEVVDG